MYKCKDNGKLYTLTEAIEYWCDNYDFEVVQFNMVFTPEFERVYSSQMRFI